MMLIPLGHTGPNFNFLQSAECDMYDNLNVNLGMRGFVKTLF